VHYQNQTVDRTGFEPAISTPLTLRSDKPNNLPDTGLPLPCKGEILSHALWMQKAEYRASTYDADIEMALKMEDNKAVQVDVPQGREAGNVGMALRARLVKLGHINKLHVSRAGDNVYILKGPSRTIKKKAGK
jgi:hypothetical protein